MEQATRRPQAKLKEEGVLKIGIQPKGKKEWSVVEQDQKEVMSHRGKTEGVIGSLKSKRYDFKDGRQRTNQSLIAAGSASNTWIELEQPDARPDGQEIETSQCSQTLKQNRANEKMSNRKTENESNKIISANDLCNML